MMRPGIARVLLSVLVAVTYAAACAATAGAQTVPAKTTTAELLILAGSDSAALLAQNTSFQPTLQLQATVRAGLGFRWPGGYELAGGFAISNAPPTSAFAGFSYAGWTARSAWMSLGYLGVPRGYGVRKGVRVRVAGNLAQYRLTYLAWFFPSVELVPTVRVPIAGPLYASLEVPVGWQFRHDLAVRFSPAREIPGAPYIGLSASLTMTAPRPARE